MEERQQSTGATSSQLCRLWSLRREHIGCFSGRMTTELWLQRGGEAVGSVASQGSSWALEANPLTLLPYMEKNGTSLRIVRKVEWESAYRAIITVPNIE